MQKTERALVVGGTRGTGLLIANLLLAGGYNVRVLGFTFLWGRPSAGGMAARYKTGA